MSRGFTFLELVITLVLLSILTSIAAPSFYKLRVNSQMFRAADELSGFLVQARSEAVWRNRDLWAHFSISSQPTFARDWSMTLTDSEVRDSGNKILVLQGSSFKDLQIDWTYTADKIKFDGTRGRVKDGSLRFYPEGLANNGLKLKTSFAGNRIMICSGSGGAYGFPSC